MSKDSIPNGFYALHYETLDILLNLEFEAKHTALRGYALRSSETVLFFTQNAELFKQKLEPEIEKEGLFLFDNNKRYGPLKLCFEGGSFLEMSNCGQIEVKGKTFYQFALWSNLYKSNIVLLAHSGKAIAEAFKQEFKNVFQEKINPTTRSVRSLESFYAKWLPSCLKIVFPERVPETTNHLDRVESLDLITRYKSLRLPIDSGLRPLEYDFKGIIEEDPLKPFVFNEYFEDFVWQPFEVSVNTSCMRIDPMPLGYAPEKKEAPDIVVHYEKDHGKTFPASWLAPFDELTNKTIMLLGIMVTYDEDRPYIIDHYGTRYPMEPHHFASSMDKSLQEHGLFDKASVYSTGKTGDYWFSLCFKTPDSVIAALADNIELTNCRVVEFKGLTYFLVTIYKDEEIQRNVLFTNAKEFYEAFSKVVETYKKEVNEGIKTTESSLPYTNPFDDLSNATEAKLSKTRNEKFRIAKQSGVQYVGDKFDPRLFAAMFDMSLDEFNLRKLAGFVIDLTEKNSYYFCIEADFTKWADLTKGKHIKMSNCSAVTIDEESYFCVTINNKTESELTILFTTAKEFYDAFKEYLKWLDFMSSF